MVTEEETRAKDLIKVVCDKTDRALYVWTSTKGFCKEDKPVSQSPDLLVAFQHIYSVKERAVFLMIDVHPYMDRFASTAPIVLRHLKDMSNYLPTTSSSLVLITPTFSLNPDVDKLIKQIELPLPNFEVFQKRLLTKLEEKNLIEGNKEEKEKLLLAASGLTLKQAEDAFFEIISGKGKVGIDDIGSILQKKKGLIKCSGLLEFIDVSNQDIEIGGMDILKDWLKRIRKCFGEEARKAGIKVPRGILLIGVSGCGKSAIIQATAKEWGMFLIRLNPARLFEKYVGDSEANIRKVIQIIEVLAPCVLWIDEIEKGFPKSSSHDSTGTSQRILGTFLTWLAEKKSAVFIMTTANDISQIPLELTRKGRIDEIFFFDLPVHKERKQIFEIHLRNYSHDPLKINLEKLADASAGFSGSEIEGAVEESSRNAFYDGAELSTDNILNLLKTIIPVSVQRKEEIASLKAWANGRARNASSPDIDAQERQTRWDTLEGGDEKNS